MLSIGELANRIGVPTHVLRYWETRFPELKPLQRSGRRRYYRVEDVALAERIYDLLHVRGYTAEGARKLILEGDGAEAESRAPVMRDALQGDDSPGADAMTRGDEQRSADTAPAWREPAVAVSSLIDLRQRLAGALARHG